MPYTQPSNAGRESNANSYYAGTPLVANSILDSQRIYDRRTALLTYIEEGRASFARLLLNYARMRGAYVAGDVETRWGIEYARLNRVYLNAATGSTGTNTHDVLKVGSDGARIQKDDVFAFMGFYVPVNRDVSGLSNDIPTVTKAAATPLPELVKVIRTVQTSTGYDVYVERNFGGVGLGAHADLGVNATPGNARLYSNFFLWAMSNSLEENSDDRLIYSDTNDWDYNYCQYIMSKWGSGEVEENVNRFFENPGESTFQRNARRELGTFFDKLDVTALLGVRKSTSVNGKFKGYAGGLLDFVPSGNYHDIDSSFFATKNFNSEMKDKFFYGAQTKLALCGMNVYTEISNMLDNKIILPAATNGWGLELTKFNVTNGGTLLLAASDTMSLNGMEDYMILYDPAHFQYGHLQNMDIKQITPPVTNPHEKTGEIYGMITFKRTNPDAHHVFVLS